MTPDRWSVPVNLHRPTGLLAVVAASLLPTLDSEVRASGKTLAIGTAEGQQHPDFLLPSLDGGFLRLSDYRGKKVFLFHFASW